MEEICDTHHCNLKYSKNVISLLIKGLLIACGVVDGNIDFDRFILS